MWEATTTAKNLPDGWFLLHLVSASREKLHHDQPLPHAVGERLNLVGHIATLSLTDRQVFEYLQRLCLGQLMRRCIPPRDQFVGILHQRNRPLMERVSSSYPYRFVVKRHHI